MIERTVIRLESETDRRMSEDVRRTRMAVIVTPCALKSQRTFSSADNKLNHVCFCVSAAEYTLQIKGYSTPK